MNQDSGKKNLLHPDSPPAGFLWVVGAAVFRRGLCLAARRAAHVAHPGAWEFPGGKVEAGESPRGALRRELREELGLEVRVEEFLGRGLIDAPRAVALDVYCCRWTAGELTLSDHDAVRWIAARQARGGMRWAPADVPVLPALEARLEEEAAGRQPSPR
ncbi:MAG: NUDIX domain-containing protein [Acidobacteriota bacterium]